MVDVKGIKQLLSQKTGAEIRNVDSEDFLPKRLERYIDVRDPDQVDRDNKFVKVKIVDLQKGEVLNPLELSGLLLVTLPNNFKVAGRNDNDLHGFTRIRVIDAKKDRFLNIKDVRYLFEKMIPSDHYEFFVEDI